MEDTQRPPRDGLVRAQPGDFDLRSPEDGTGGMPTMFGHFARFNEWTEIESLWEGHFLERVEPGAFARTFKNNRNHIRVTFNHGTDPSLGDKVLGPIDELEEDDEGARYAVPLLDTSYNRDLLPGLTAGLYGSSFRFRVLREDFDHRPKASDHNPDGLPERTIREAQVFEFGPVTFPAYAGATAGVRSLTDHLLLRQLTGDPERLTQLLSVAPTAGPAPAHSEPEARPSTQPAVRRFQSREDYLEWISRI